jgi:hypothetical protein
MITHKSFKSLADIAEHYSQSQPKMVIPQKECTNKNGLFLIVGIIAAGGISYLLWKNAQLKKKLERQFCPPILKEDKKDLELLKEKEAIPKSDNEL